MFAGFLLFPDFGLNGELVNEESDLLSLNKENKCLFGRI